MYDLNEHYFAGVSIDSSQEVTRYMLITFNMNSPKESYSCTNIGSVISEVDEFKDKESGQCTHSIVSTNHLLADTNFTIVDVQMQSSATDSEEVWYFALKCIPGQPSRYITSFKAPVLDEATKVLRKRWVRAQRMQVNLTFFEDLTYFVVCFDKNKFFKVSSSKSPLLSPLIDLSKVTVEIDSISKQLYLVYVPREDDVYSPYTILPLKITLY